MKDAGGHGSEAKMAPEAPEAPEAKMAPMKGEAKVAPEAPEAAMDSRVRGVLANGHPKSAPVPVHSGATGRGGFPSNANFVAKYGGPRNHAAEQRGFNSGAREINRLKRQGK